MKELVEYLDEFVEELRDQLESPENKKDKRWRNRPPSPRDGKPLPFRRGAKWGKLGLRMGQEALVVWVRENKIDWTTPKGKNKV